MLDINRIQQLVDKGNDVLKTHKPNPSNMIGFTTLNNGEFAAWKTQVLNYLHSNLQPDNQYILSFERDVKEAYVTSTQQGVGILKSIKEDLELGLLNGSTKDTFNPITPLLTIFERFHHVVRKLRNRYSDRPTLNVLDEYDVQDLLHSLLTIHFDDIRPEEWTPSYAGKGSRMDFLLKDYKTVIEVKKTRVGLAGKEVGTQLIDDIVRYQQHQDCETLLCFVYDPEGLIGNPRGLENDLSNDNGKIKVRVYIRP